jgi:hypothetical protein
MENAIFGQIQSICFLSKCNETTFLLLLGQLKPILETSLSARAIVLIRILHRNRPMVGSDDR